VLSEAVEPESVWSAGCVTPCVSVALGPAVVPLATPPPGLPDSVPSAVCVGVPPVPPELVSTVPTTWEKLPVAVVPVASVCVWLTVWV
jgi:hypothetical protein